MTAPTLSPADHNSTKDATMTDPIQSQSDDRTANNAVRHQYRVLSDDEKRQMVAIKDAGAAFIALCDDINSSASSSGRGSREMSLAKTNAEQAVMWAVKHITS